MQQIALDLFSEEHLPRKPWCSDDLEFGIKVRPLNIAIRMKYIQHNHPGMLRFMVFDIDRPEAGGVWIDSKAPAPNVIIKNPKNGHAHYVYALSAPVCTTENARIKPLQYAAAIERTIRVMLDADSGYSGLLTKNPHHWAWQAIDVREKPYSLEELAGDFNLLSAANDPKKHIDICGLDRNCTIFELLRKWAYSNVVPYWKPAGYDAWLSAVRDQAHSHNEFAEPLLRKEVEQIAKSVAKWVWKRFSPAGRRALIERTHTPEIQSKRGKMKGKALRERGILMLKEGASISAVIEETGTSRATAYRWLKIAENENGS